MTSKLILIHQHSKESLHIPHPTSDTVINHNFNHDHCRRSIYQRLQDLHPSRYSLLETKTISH